MRPDLKIIAIARTVEACYPAGRARTTLSKPFDSATIAAVVERLLN